MKEKLVTVVVPIYNVEKYLNACIESVVSQTYRNLEIILVDDGSTDSCPMICDEWAKKDNRIKVIHKKNQGLGMARNTGIDHAAGDYICFFDSDDYVDLCTIEKAYEIAEQYDTDVVLFGMKDFDSQGREIQKTIPQTEKTFFCGREVQEELLPDLIDSSCTGSKNRGIPFSACTCLFSMRLISNVNWRFVSERDIISEDSYSLVALYKDVRKAYVICEAYYCRLRNEGSLSSSYRADRFEKSREFFLKSCELAHICGFSDKVIRSLCSLFFNFVIDCMKQIIGAPIPWKTKLKAFRQIVSDETFRNCIKKCEYGNSSKAKRILKNAILMRCTMLTISLVYLRMRRR